MRSSFREQLIAVIAEAIRANTDSARSELEIVMDVVESKGMNRAIWGTLSPTDRLRALSRASRLARKRKP